MRSCICWSCFSTSSAAASCGTATRQAATATFQKDRISNPLLILGTSRRPADAKPHPASGCGHGSSSSSTSPGGNRSGALQPRTDQPIHVDPCVSPCRFRSPALMRLGPAPCDLQQNPIAHNTLRAQISESGGRHYRSTRVQRRLGEGVWERPGTELRTLGAGLTPAGESPQLLLVQVGEGPLTQSGDAALSRQRQLAEILRAVQIECRAEHGAAKSRLRGAGKRVLEHAPGAHGVIEETCERSAQTDQAVATVAVG